MTEARTPPSAEVLLQRAIDVIASSRPMPLSASVMIARDEVLELLEAARDRLPDEMTEARWVLKERDDVLARAHEEGEAILREAQARAGQMVQRTEVVREAEERARRIVAQAHDEARRMKRQVEDFCDQRLAAFEVAVERIEATVRDARSRLQLTPAAPPEQEPPGPPDTFFDQDHS